MVENTLELCDGGREILNGADRPSQKDDLQTAIVIDMHMCCADDLMVVMVLDLGKVVFEFALVMIVDHGQHTHGGRVGVLHLLRHQPRADQIAQCLRPIHIRGTGDVFVELFQQPALERNAKPDKVLHGSTLFINVARIHKKVK